MDDRFINSDYERKAKVWVVVATHKAFEMPTDKMYIPLHVGAEGKTDENGNALDLGFQKDNTGDNISDKNAQFCELTGLYWAWKNLKADYIGLAHYRRHFEGSRKGELFDRVLKYKQINPLLGNIKVFVPKKRHYYIETLEQHYAHNHHIKELETAKDIMLEKYPEYGKAYDKAMNRTWGYMFNMMIMKRELVDDYCNWIFSILFEMTERLAKEGDGGAELSAFENRFPGRVSERLFNVWLEHCLEVGNIKADEIREIPFMYMEKINKLNKAYTFLRAKFVGIKPQKSF